MQRTRKSAASYPRRYKRGAGLEKPEGRVDMVTVAAIQMTSGPDVEANLATAGRLLEQAAERGAVIAGLPENFAFMGLKETDKRAVAETDGTGPIQEFLSATAQRLRMWVIGGTIPVKAVDDPAQRAAAACLV